MVYPCFYYSLKGVKMLNILVYYTTKEQLPRFYKLKDISSWVRYYFGIFLLSLHTACTFLISIQDNMEFMMRLVETISVSYILYEFFLMRLNFQDFVDLINLMKRTFSVADTAIIRACKREEKTWFFSFATLLCGAICLGVTEIFIRSSDDWNQKRAKFYGYKYPNHPIPLNVYIPGNFIDLSAPPTYYIYFLLSPYFAMELTAAASLIFTGMGMFSIHIRGQYKMLHRYIRTIYRPDMDARGNRKYYTNIVTGQYFTCDPMNPLRITLFTPRSHYLHASQEDASHTNEKTMANIRHIISYYNPPDKSNEQQDVRSGNRSESSSAASGSVCQRDYYNPIYEEYLLKQIIQWQQHLFNYRSKVETYMRPLVINTCFAFISIVALCSQLVLKCHYKITYGFVFVALILHVTKLVEFSDELEDHSQEVQAMLYFDSEWYRRSRQFRTIVSLIVVRSMKSEHYSFFGGLVTFDRPLLLSLWSDTYTFINWLIYLNAH